VEEAVKDTPYEKMLKADLAAATSRADALAAELEAAKAERDEAERAERSSNALLEEALCVQRLRAEKAEADRDAWKERAERARARVEVDHPGWRQRIDDEHEKCCAWFGRPCDCGVDEAIAVSGALSDDPPEVEP